MANGDDSIGIIPNVLEQFSSYNTIFTISALTTEQLNFPDSALSYKNNQLGEIILRSASGMPNSRMMTAYQTNDNPEGKYEFYIDNVNIEAIISFDKRTNGSNATDISFEVIEPYSMGLFLQSLQLAAAAVSDAGVLATYTETPFLLTIQFIGYDEAGNVIVIDDSLDRHIPFTFTNMEMDVSASGSRYKVTAIPHNEEALKDSANKAKEDIAISGLTVQEILQTGKDSLQYRLNTYKKEIAKQGSETNKEEYTPDQIVIIFPKDRSVGISAPNIGEDLGQPVSKNPNNDGGASTARQKLSLKQEVIKTGVGSAQNITNVLVQDAGSLNPIGASKMGFTANTGGESQPVPANEIQKDPNKPPVRKNNGYDPANKVFRFSQGTSIISMITEVLLMSEYCKTSVAGPSDESGLKSWFRIETQVYNLKPDLGNANRAKRPKLFVYKVVEYKVHEHRFKPPGAAPQGYEQLKKNCVKEYNYLYSGKNVDILNFNINLKTAMFTTAYSDMNAMAGSVYPQLNGAGTEKNSQPTNAESNKNAADPGMPVIPVGEMTKRYKNVGGGPNDDYRSLVAKNFQESLLNSPSDMLSIEMEIMGDPYYLADSGMGNFSDIPVTFNINENGSMNYQSGEVDIIINFRTPLDYNSGGYIDFSQGSDVNGFSGIYNVLEVTNNFNRGKFTQTLKAIRRPVQEPKKNPASNLFDSSGSEALVDETGQTSNLRRNLETGELYDATGLYGDDGKPMAVNPNSKTQRKAVDAVSPGTRGGQVEYTSGVNTKIPGTL